VITDPFKNDGQQYIQFLTSDPEPDPGVTDSWSVGDIKPGESGKITISARVVQDVPVGTTRVKDLGRINSNETEPQRSNPVFFNIYRQPPEPPDPDDPQPTIIEQIVAPTTGRGTTIAIAVALAVGVLSALGYVAYRQKWFSEKKK